MTPKKAKKKASKKAAPQPQPSTEKKRTIPRQNQLPTMENAAIKAIEDAAYDYAEIRDQRQALTAQEVSLKTELLLLMHKEGKTEYRRNGIYVKVEVEKEKVKVRVTEEGELAAPATPAPAAPNPEPAAAEEPITLP